MPAKVRKSKSPARKVVKRKSKSPARKRKTATKKRVSGYIKFLKAYKKCYPDNLASAADLSKKWGKLSKEKKEKFSGATYAQACALIEKYITVRHRSRAVAKKRKASKSPSRKSTKKSGKKRSSSKSKSPSRKSTKKRSSSKSKSPSRKSTKKGSKKRSSSKSGKSGKTGKTRKLPLALRLWLQAARNLGYLKKTKDGKFKKLPKRGTKAYAAIKKEYLRLKKKHGLM